MILRERTKGPNRGKTKDENSVQTPAKGKKGGGGLCTVPNFSSAKKKRKEREKKKNNGGEGRKDLSKTPTKEKDSQHVIFSGKKPRGKVPPRAFWGERHPRKRVR